MVPSQSLQLINKFKKLCSELWTSLFKSWSMHKEQCSSFPVNIRYLKPCYLEIFPSSDGFTFFPHRTTRLQTLLPTSLWLTCPTTTSRADWSNWYVMSWRRCWMICPGKLKKYENDTTSPTDLQSWNLFEIYFQFKSNVPKIDWPRISYWTGLPGVGIC